MKICVYLHLFYTEMLDDMLDYLAVLSEDKELEYDLIVTVCSRNEELENKIYAFKDNALILRVPNRGYDLAPFLFALKRSNPDNYDYIIKLHSKRDLTSPAYLPFCTFKGSEWRHKLLEFMATPKNLAATLKVFEKFPDTGMVSSRELIISSKKEDTIATARAERIMRGMGLELKNRQFIAGTMFIARAKLFKICQLLPYDAQDFEEFDVSHRGGTLAHAMERVLGYIISAQGYKIRPYRSVCFFKLAWFKIKNFIFYRRINSKNKLHIKICKIPVYSKQL